MRTVAWFSCGAASAVAAKMALDRDPATIVARCIVPNEHPDNDRFARDVERWLGVQVLELRSTKYVDCWEVWEKRRFLNSPYGALCTTEMKKKVRQNFEEPGDVQVFGYTIDEAERIDRFAKENPDQLPWFPLYEMSMTKQDCFHVIMDAGLVLPAMYRLGYSNANCIGCVKGGAGYWNKIRRDFPEVFERMAALEDRIGATCLRKKVKGEKRTERLPLRLLPPTAGRLKDLQLPDCGLFCGTNPGPVESDDDDA